MLKKFCDLCERPALRELSVEVAKAFGPERVDEEFNPIQARVNVRAVFTFTNHPSGFGGPPDLCAHCAMILLAELQEQMRVTTLVGEVRKEQGKG
jgi:hypothetical protein